MHVAQNYAASASPTAASTPFTVYTNSEQGDVEQVPLDQTLQPGGEPNDRDLATQVLQTLNALQEALDAATLAGLIVEPSFKAFPNRFKDRGSDADSFVARANVYRRLA